MASDLKLVHFVVLVWFSLAKNVTLAGPKRVTLHDTVVSTKADLASHYYLKEQDLGKNRAALSVASVSELNPYVQLDSSNASWDDLSFLKTYSCVVLVGSPLSLQLRVPWWFLLLIVGRWTNFVAKMGWNISLQTTMGCSLGHLLTLGTSGPLLTKMVSLKRKSLLAEYLKAIPQKSQLLMRIADMI